MPKNINHQRLTELELEIMATIWELGETTIAEVVSRLQEKKKYAYTTVATIMNILEKKKYLKVRKRDRAHKYLAIIEKNEYESTAIGHLVNRLFDGDPKRLVMKLIDASNIEKAELEEIRKSLKRRMENV